MKLSALLNKTFRAIFLSVLLFQLSSVQAVEAETINRGKVTEDITLDNGRYLYTSGTISRSITNDTISRLIFTSSVIYGEYGYIYIFSSGSWLYIADNKQNEIQQLTKGQIITDTFNITSSTGVNHPVIITIEGSNDAAKITGDDSGRVTRDENLLSNNYLFTAGMLLADDIDSGENSFNYKSIRTDYGNLYIRESGQWYYLAVNRQTQIQSLRQNQTLTESISVSSKDDTSHQIVVTITSPEYVDTSGTLNLKWSPPSKRDDGSTLFASEISGYRIYYGTQPEIYDKSIDISNPNNTSYQLTGISKDRLYYLVMTSVDIDGRESLYSTETTLKSK